MHLTAYDSMVTITKDNEWEYTKKRWNKYTKQHKGNKGVYDAKGC